jgi:hypothetical protein
MNLNLTYKHKKKQIVLPFSKKENYGCKVPKNSGNIQPFKAQKVEIPLFYANISFVAKKK